MCYYAVCISSHLRVKLAFRQNSRRLTSQDDARPSFNYHHQALIVYDLKLTPAVSSDAVKTQSKGIFNFVTVICVQLNHTGTTVVD